MEPRIDRTQFGSVTIDGETITHDVIIRLGGRVEKRKKKLSKAVYGTSHTISLAEAEYVYQKGAERLLIGAGQHGRVGLSEQAAAYLARNRCQVELLSTPAGWPRARCRRWRDATTSARSAIAAPAHPAGAGRTATASGSTP